MTAKQARSDESPSQVGGGGGAGGGSGGGGGGGGGGDGSRSRRRGSKSGRGGGSGKRKSSGDDIELRDEVVSKVKAGLKPFYLAGRISSKDRPPVGPKAAACATVSPAARPARPDGRTTSNTSQRRYRRRCSRRSRAPGASGRSARYTSTSRAPSKNRLCFSARRARRRRTDSQRRGRFERRVEWCSRVPKGHGDV